MGWATFHTLIWSPWSQVIFTCVGTYPDRYLGMPREKKSLRCRITRYVPRNQVLTFRKGERIVKCNEWALPILYMLFVVIH
jgi:hypothetical protein